MLIRGINAALCIRLRISTKISCTGPFIQRPRTNTADQGPGPIGNHLIMTVLLIDNLIYRTFKGKYVGFIHVDHSLIQLTQEQY